jgi:hypothetical protein
MIFARCDHWLEVLQEVLLPQLADETSAQRR